MTCGNSSSRCCWNTLRRVPRDDLAAVIGGANVPDTKFLDATLTAIVVDRPDPESREQHLCLDKRDDNPTGKAVVRSTGTRLTSAASVKTHPAHRIDKSRQLLMRRS